MSDGRVLLVGGDRAAAWVSAEASSTWRAGALPARRDDAHAAQQPRGRAPLRRAGARRRRLQQRQHRLPDGRPLRSRHRHLDRGQADALRPHLRHRHRAPPAGLPRAGGGRLRRAEPLRALRPGHGQVDGGRLRAQPDALLPHGDAPPGRAGGGGRRRLRRPDHLVYPPQRRRVQSGRRQVEPPRASLHAARRSHAATAPAGRTAAGDRRLGERRPGQRGPGPRSSSTSVEVYDPPRRPGRPGRGRSIRRAPRHTATLLDDGAVLVAGRRRRHRLGARLRRGVPRRPFSRPPRR